MPRLMSVSLTEQAVIERRKTVTRRLGWKFLNPGDRLTLCRKVMGRKKGDPLVRLAEVEVESVTRELLDSIDALDVVMEGMDDQLGPNPAAFVEFFCAHMGCTPDTEVTRIEWKYLEATS